MCVLMSSSMQDRFICFCPIGLVHLYRERISHVSEKSHDTLRTKIEHDQADMTMRMILFSLSTQKTPRNNGICSRIQHDRFAVCVLK